MFNSDLRTTPIWRETYDAKATPAGDFPDRADVVVVGSGYTGASAALTLAEAGINVVVLEADELGHGASTRNFGYAIGPESRDRYTDRYGKDEVDRIVEGYSAAGEHLAGLIKRFGTETVEVRTEGMLALAHDLKAFTRMRAGVPGDESQILLHRKDLTGIIGSAVFQGGILSRNAVAVDPGKLHATLVKQAMRAGARIFDHCPAMSIRHRPAGGFVVTTPQGEISCNEVALATNGHSGKLNPFLRRRIVPVVGTVIATEELPDDLAAGLLPQGHWCVDSQLGFRCFRMSPDNKRMIFAKAGLPGHFGGDVRPYARRVHAAMTRTFPQLNGTRIDYAWPASVAVTFDALPHLGRKDGVWHAGGYNGHGVAMSHYLGHMMARRLMGDSGDPLFVEEKPFATSIFYTGNTWFMPVLRQIIKLKGLKS